MEREYLVAEEVVATPVVPGASTAVVEPGAVGDRVPLKWGPIWAGLLAALGIFVLLSLLAIALGLQAAPGIDEDLGFAASIVTSVIALFAFFIGGFIAAWSANVADPGRAMLNGFLVWALWLLLILLLGAFGAGQVFGVAADLLRPGQIDVDLEPAQLVRVVRDSAWQGLLILGLTAAAAALGGVVGAREEIRTRWAY